MPPGGGAGAYTQADKLPTATGAIELWDSILDYFFINHTLRPGPLARRIPLRSHRQQAALLSELVSLHRITSPLSTLPSMATQLN